MLKRIIIPALLLIPAWCVMAFSHELGHIIAGYFSGATLTDYRIAPWRLPYSMHSPDPHPLVTLWAGPIVGIIAPLLVAEAIRRPWAWFIADFCLLTNGLYLALAWLSGDPTLDTQRLLTAGASPLWIIAFCAVTIPAGYVRLRADCIELMSTPERDNNARSQD